MNDRTLKIRTQKELKKLETEKRQMELEISNGVDYWKDEYRVYQFTSLYDSYIRQCQVTLAEIERREQLVSYPETEMLQS